MSHNSNKTKKTEDLMNQNLPNQIEEAEDTGLFDKGDWVEVLSNKTDTFKDFTGRIVGFKGSGIISVKDQDDNVWDVGENQCEKIR